MDDAPNAAVAVREDSPAAISATAADLRGLTTAEADRRLVEFGPNSVTDPTPNLWRRGASKLWAPVPWMLEAAIVLQLALGEYVEAAVIAGLLLFNAALSFVQESRAQATLDALRARLAVVGAVRRDGSWVVLPVSALVPGDVVKLSLGKIVGADVEVLDGNVLLDHAMLTGESLPVEAGPGTRSYAGALVRRGEALARVTATGSRTKFGHTAELVRTARSVSSQQSAVLRVVRNLAIFNGGVAVLQIAYAVTLGLPVGEIVPLMLTAMLAAIPVALPATFTLASALGARALARSGVLPTRLSAVDEAASMDILCADKTGTLTQNALAVTAVRAMAGFDERLVLSSAAAASSDGGPDPVDSAVRAAARHLSDASVPRVTGFVPFDPARKMAEATIAEPDGGIRRVVKGAYAAVQTIAPASPEAAAAAAELEAQGYRVLAVAEDQDASGMRIAGLIALSDPPRPESKDLIAELAGMGVKTVMLTGDAPATAATVARAVGLDGKVCPRELLPKAPNPEGFRVFAGIFPEDKFHIVSAFQQAGHVVGMCGDGANDAPALRQAQMGIAVSTATDVAKSAAGIVLTEPGLTGIVAAVHEGRIVFQRILTYVLRSLTRKIDQLLFLTAGLIMTGHAILTPMIMVVLMIIGDFLAMSATTDNVRPSQKPNAWRIDRLTVAGIMLAGCNLAFCTGVLAIGKYGLGLDLESLRSLAAVTLVFSGQAVMYAVRERRRLWSSRPGTWLILASTADVAIITTLALKGVLIAPLPGTLVASTLLAALVFAFLLDWVKTMAFRLLRMS